MGRRIEGSISISEGGLKDVHISEDGNFIENIFLYSGNYVDWFQEFQTADSDTNNTIQNISIYTYM